MRKTINIFLIIIGINFILSLSVFFYHEQKPENMKEKKYSYINNWQINYEKVDFSKLILDSIRINNININLNEEYDISMFIKKYDEYKNVKFEILNEETYKDSGKYKIKIKAYLGDSFIIKTAYLTINEEKNDNTEIVDVTVEQPIVNNYIPVIQPPVTTQPVTNNSETKQEINNSQNNSEENNNQENNKEQSNNQQENNQNSQEQDINQQENNNNQEQENNQQENNQNNQEQENNQEEIPTENPINGVYYDTYAYQVFNIINILRSENNLQPLVWDTTLVENAKIRAYEASISFSHTRPDGSAFYTAFTNIVYPVGENLAIGYLTPQAVVDGWMASESHKANILDPSYTKIGISMYQVNGTNYWSQLFTG